MKKNLLLILSIGFMTLSCSSKPATAQKSNAMPADSVATVYFVADISPENVLKIYHALGKEAVGEKVAVKISTGESNHSNHLDPALVSDFIHEVKGTIVECNTAYSGNRNSTEKHYQAAVEHGYTAVATVDIMDSESEIDLPLEGGFHLSKDIVGAHVANYDFWVILSHFKGHPSAGFGGALKNVAIGMASSAGKAYIHSAGQTADVHKCWRVKTEQDDFLESMADACKAVQNHIGDKVIYISIANRLSVDCDCVADPQAPEMGDLGIFASLDPVALDRACVDAVFNSADPGKGALIERINSRHGTHILDAAEQLGVGTQKYQLITLE